eukprot:gene51472-56867_t
MAAFHFRWLPVLRATWWVMLGLHACACAWIALSGAPYLTALYLVMMTVTTVGYGDVSIDTQQQRCFCILLFAVGVVANGVIVGKVTVALSNSGVDSARRGRMQETLLVLRHFDIPQVVQSEILSYQMHMLQYHLTSSYSDVITSLPAQLRDSLGITVAMRLVRGVAAFARAGEAAQVALARALTPRLYAPGELVAVAGDAADHAFIL